jgi:RloB-like protein
MKRNKIYERREPTKQGKLYFIFCEGADRETTYFYYFNKLASQIILQIVPIDGGKNSPMGLYKNACQKLIKGPENLNPQYDLNVLDEVWFIIDTDKWGPEIIALRNVAKTHINWFIGQSNPCFEVWLYFHFHDQKPENFVANWKDYLNTVVKGGFDNRKHPVYIKRAIDNSIKNYSILDNKPDINSTELHVLGEKIYQLVQEDIIALLDQNNIQ